MGTLRGRSALQPVLMLGGFRGRQNHTSASGALHLPSLLRQRLRACRYAWFSPDAETELLTGPNALYYGAGNQTALTGLGKIYLDQLYDSGCSSVR